MNNYSKDQFYDWMINFISDKSDLNGKEVTDLIQDNIFDKGYVDSFGLMTMIVKLEEDYEIQFDPDDFQDRRFATIKGLAELVEEKKNGN